MENSSIQGGNNTEGNTTEGLLPLHKQAKPMFFAALVLQWINVVLILSLNTTVIVMVLRHKKKSRLYFLLMNMAIADLTTGLVDALFNALERSLGITVLDYWWFGGTHLCKVQRYVSSVSLCASNFLLAATSVDRAFVVAKPMMNFKRGYALQKTLIVVCWLFGAVINIPLFDIVHLKLKTFRHTPGKTVFPSCDADLSSTEEWKVLFGMMLLFYVLLPLVVIIVSYSILIYSIYKRARTSPNSLHGFDNLNISLVFNRGLPSSKTRSIKLTFGIVLSFILSWSPYFIAIYLNLRHPVSMLFVTFYYWNCVANPVVFFLFHKRGTKRSPISFYSNDTPLNKTANCSVNRNISVRDFNNAEKIPTKSDSKKTLELELL